MYQPPAAEGYPPFKPSAVRAVSGSVVNRASDYWFIRCSEPGVRLLVHPLQ